VFYREILGDRKYEYVPRSGWYSNYRIAIDARYVVFTNSTLGHECLGRGKRVACLSARGAEFIESADYKFGWPLALPDSGPFWTNLSDTGEFKRVLDYVTTVDDAEWMKSWRAYGPDQMDYDPGNTRLRTLLERLDVPTVNDEARMQRQLSDRKTRIA
jgi:surface carbohydrate biosynthesis protein